MITKAVISLLASSTSISALVSTRIYPNVIKTDSAFPAIAVSTDSMGKLGCDDAAGVKMGRIQIVIFASTYAAVYNILTAVRSLLDEYSGKVSGVGLTIIAEGETPDDYDEVSKMHIKVIEYEACAQVSA